MPKWPLRRIGQSRCGRALLVACAAAACAGPGAGTAAAAVTATETFTTPGHSGFTVPAGVTSITVTAIGAAGGSIIFGGCIGAGGQGAQVTATMTVAPGEELRVGVGGVGGAGACGQPVGGAGGVGGGGRGGDVGTGNGGAAPGAGGGGASLVGRPAVSPGFNPLLVVAGGGGGAGGFHGGDGGAAGASGEAGSNGAIGGGPGTATAGGGGGVSVNCGDTTSGTNGEFGRGGAGGTSFPADPFNDPGGVGGGGGGGGWFGGGGGGATCLLNSGAGGGGGSSFVAEGVLTATPTAAPARVSITYAAPTADLSGQTISFAATQPLGVVSPEQQVTLTNNGDAPLLVTRAALSGANPGDYVVQNRCQAPVSPAGSCVLAVRFAPQAAGPRAASLTLQTNAATQPPPVTLSGTGGALPEGPAGPQGDTGAVGATGVGGAPGAAGAIGPQGLAGKNGVVRLVTCRTVRRNGRRRKRCTTKNVSGPVTLTTPARAVIARRGVVYATGSAVRAGNGWRLMVTGRRTIAPGRYTLALRARGVTRRTRIRIQ